jgi:hypothetical protein
MAVTVANNSVKMTADNDLFPSASANPRPSYHVSSISYNIPAGATSVVLKAGSTSGPVLWEWLCAGGAAAAVSGNAQVSFETGYGVHLDTDATVSVILHLGNC